MPYGFFGCIRVHGDSFLMGDGRIFEIREYRQSGALKRIIRADLEPKRIASADKAGEKERILAFYGRKTASSGFERFGLLYLGARPCLRSNDSNSPRMGGCGSNSIGESTKHRAGYSLIPTDARAGSSTSHLRFEIRQIRSNGVLGVTRTADDEESVAPILLPAGDLSA